MRSPSFTSEAKFGNVADDNWLVLIWWVIYTEQTLSDL